MRDSTLTKDHDEERREHMVSPSKNNRPSSSSDKTHLLKPCSTISIDGSEALFPPQNPSTSSPPVSKALSLSVSFKGRRFPNVKFKSWARKMSALHEPIWEKAGIFEAVAASSIKICNDSDLVLGIVEKWCPDTKTFVFPWGEATITLEDVMVLLGFSVLGSPVFATLDSSGEEIKERVEKEWLKIKREKFGFVTQAVWIKRFINSGNDDDDLEHVAFLVLWLSYFVFPSRYHHIPRDVLSVAVHLSRGKRIALAPAVLAHLYAELTLLKDHIGRFAQGRNTEKLDLTSLFKLVKVWTWERFKELRPRPNMMLKGEVRLTLWNDLRQPRTRDVRQILDSSSMDSFEWRPYTKTLKNWEFPKFYPEREMWVPVGPGLDEELIPFARCIKMSELVGIDCVEHYFPNRVASQFGLLQDVPCPVNRNNLSKKEAWTDYNKQIEDLTLFIPSRSAMPRVTSMFCEWWKVSFPQLHHSLKGKGVVESSRNLIGDAYDTSTSDSKRQKHMKRLRVDNESFMVPSENDEEDYSVTVAEVNDKKYSVGDASEPLCKKCRLEVENKYSGIASIRADVDKPVTPPEIEQRKETDETVNKAGKCIVLSPCDETDPSHPPSAFSGAPPETRNSCDGELDVCGRNVEKMTMIDYGSKETKCSLHEDGAIAGEKESSESLIYKEHDDNSLIQIKLAIDEADNNEQSPQENLASGGSNRDEASKASKRMIQNPSDEPNIHISVGDGTQGHDCLFDDDDIGSEDNIGMREIDIHVSPPETRQACDEELGVYGSNAEKMAMTDDSSKEPENLLHDDGAMAGVKLSSDVKEDDDSLIQQKLSLNADKNEPITRQKRASGGPNGDETSDESNILNALGEGDVSDESNDSYEKSLQNVKMMALSIEERIIKLQRNVAWLKARKATKQKKIAAAARLL